MNQILEDYEGRYELMYLFANRSVLEFYPKFGFRGMDETQFHMEYTGEREQVEVVRKLDVQNAEHLRMIYDQAQQRVPVSSLFGTNNAAELVMFYATYVFPDDIYYLEQSDVIVFCKQESHELHLFDVITRSPIEMKRIIDQLATKGTTEIIFHFTPDDPTLSLQKTTYQGSEVLFVKHQGTLNFPAYFKHPLTSQA